MEWQTLCFSSCKNRKLKVKLWWVDARERKKRACFVPFILPEGYFFNIYVLSPCIVYWIHFRNIHTFAYQKTLLHTLLLFVFKIVKSLQCILNVPITQIHILILSVSAWMLFEGVFSHRKNFKVCLAIFATLCMKGLKPSLLSFCKYVLVVILC